VEPVRTPRGTRKAAQGRDRPAAQRGVRDAAAWVVSSKVTGGACRRARRRVHLFHFEGAAWGSARAPPSAQGNLLQYLADRRAPIGEAPVRGQGRTLEEARRVEDLAKPLDPGLAWVEGQGRGGRCRPRPSFRAARQTIPRLRAVASFPPWVKAGRSTRVIAAD